MAEPTTKNADFLSLQKKLEDLERGQSNVADVIREARRPQYLAHKAIDYLTQGPRDDFARTGGFKTFGHFLRNVKSWTTNQPVQKEWTNYVTKAGPPTGLSESVLQDGGAVVPPQFVSDILRRAYANDLLSRTRMFPMAGPSLKIPAINETSRADGSRWGGIQGYWRAEAGTLTSSKPSLAQIGLSVESLSVLFRSTQELMDDAGPAMEMLMTDGVAEEIEFKLGDAIFEGDGVEKPLGLSGHVSSVAVAKESGQAASTIVAQNVVKMWARMYARCRANAVWLINQDCEPQLDQMTIGTAGAQLAVYMPPGGLSASPYATLKGRPVIPVEFASTVGTLGDITLVDLSQYVTGMRGSMQSAISIHVYFTSNENAYRFIVRFDGKPWWLSALTPFKGSNTQSWCVQLSTRS